MSTDDQVGMWQPDWTMQGLAEPFERRGHLLVPAGLDTDDDAQAALPAAIADADVKPEIELARTVDLEPAERVGTQLQLVEANELEAVEPDEVQVRALRSVRVWPTRRRGRDGDGESSAQLRERLEAGRALTQVARDDALARRVSEAEHDMAMADVAEQVAAVQRERTERSRDAAETEALVALHRRAGSAGERAAVRAAIGRTAEMRALRVAAVQKASLWTGLVLLIGFGAWSTAGVHEGLVKLLHLETASAGWFAGWIVEPLLIAIVAGLIVIRAVLRMSGGDVDWRARTAEAVALLTSLALNMFGGWAPDEGGWTVSLGQAVAHSVGAIGAAGTAWLIGVVIDYTTRAKPWEDAPRVSELRLETSGWSSGRSSAGSPGGTSAGAINRGKRPPVPVDRNNLPDDVRKLLDDVRTAIADGVLSPDPSGYAIYNNVMGKRGDKARAGTVSGLVRGWRPPLRAVGDASSAAG